MSSRAAFRADIQGLRALAVSLVLVYHLWPGRLTGGYVGVDVFFVISGFLITGHLLANPPRRPRDLTEFWARRIRRLLPAAFVVLAATAVAARLVAPPTQWTAIATEVMASALYVQNWVLASSSVDYLAAGSAPTPTQHFWSLSVEEQFYLAWPVVILLAWWVAARVRTPFPASVRTAMLAILAASLTISVLATATEPASAYFITPTRVWELAAGGVVSTLPPIRDGSSRASVAALAAWLGLAMIVVAAVTFSGSTAFPGSAALLPVLGTSLVIAASAAGPRSPTPLLALRPVQHVGDVSYSVYLWHWPLIALAPYVVGRIDLPIAAAIIVVTLVLASVTKVQVEDRFRAMPRLQPVGAAYRFAAAGMLSILVVGGAQVTEVDVRAATARLAVAAVQQSVGSCFGAEAIARGFDVCPPAAAPELVPDPISAKDDKSDAYRDDCWSNAPYSDHRVCRYGNGRVQIALVGNSHAGQWLPALQVLAAQRGWTITTYLVSQCNATDTALHFDTTAKTANCLAWGRWAMAQTSGNRYDLVITSERQSVSVSGHTMQASHDAAVAGYRTYLERWLAAGTHLLVLHDTTSPSVPDGTVPDCLAAHPTQVAACDGTPTSWGYPDPLYDAATELAPPVATANLLPYLCTDTACPAVIGSVVVYFDSSHMTATYARTLAPYLDRPIADALGNVTVAAADVPGRPARRV